MSRYRPLLAAMGSAAALLLPAAAQAQDKFLGEIVLVGFNFCPAGTLEANGQLLPIRQYQALYSLYGSTYGGDDRISFGLPDLRGRVPVGTGTAPGLSPMPLGSRGGAETVALTVAQLPPHSHSGQLAANSEGGSQASPTNGLPAVPADKTAIYGSKPNTAMAANGVTIGSTGGGQPVPIRNPYLVLRYCVVTQGNYPMRPD